jgi:hypothetical protein
MKQTTKTELLGLAGRPQVVRLYRRRLQPDENTEGFVLRVEPDLVLVHRVDPAIVLDGFQVVRVRDVTDVDDSFGSAAFIERALRLRRQRPCCPKGVGTDSLRSLIASAGKRFPLITLHLERKDKDVCWIGQLAHVDDRHVTIDYITPNAEWDGQERYALRDLTKVEFGGSYEQALAQVAARGLTKKRRMAQV